MWSVGSSNGVSLDDPRTRHTSYGYNSFGNDPGQLLQSSNFLPNRRHTFPAGYSGKVLKRELE